MFSAAINTPCNNAVFSLSTMAAMAKKLVHPSVQRLYDVAKLADAKAPAQVARRLNISAQTLNNWEARGISKEGSLLAQQVFGCNANWLVTGEGRQTTPMVRDQEGTYSVQPEWSEIVGLQIEAALGDGTVADEYAETHRLKFRAESLRRKRLAPDKLAVIYGKGDSMLPTIKDGDALLVDTSDRTPKDGKIYVITYGGDLLAKRLVDLGGRWFIDSDNKSDPKWSKPKPLDGTKGVEIHGRVRWIGSWED